MIKFLLVFSAILCIAISYDMFPDANDCTSYKLIYNDVFHSSSCSTGLHFSPTELICLPPEQAMCDRNYWCRSQTEQFFFPDPANCKAYHECSVGTPVRKLCQSDLWWDFKKNICTDSGSVECDLRSSITPSNPGQYRLESTTVTPTQQSQTTMTPKILHLTPNIESCHRKKDLFANGKYLKTICIISGGFSYESAQEQCTKNNMNLFVVDNEEAKLEFYDGIMTLLHDHPHGIVWINGRRRTFSKNWEVFNADGTVRGPLYSGANFFSQYAIGNCLKYSGEYTGQYKILPGPCTSGHWATCEHHVKTESPPRLDTSLCLYKKDLYYNGKYIKSMCIINQGLNYDQSRRKCLNQGMNLFIFDSREVEESFHESNEDTLKNHPGGAFWINGMRECATNKWHIYLPNRTVIGELYDGLEWVERNNICGRTNGNCLKFSGEHGPYQAIGCNCAEARWPICEYYK